MGKIILSAFADEYNADIDRQIEGLKICGINYIEPRFIGAKNISELTAEEASALNKKLSDNGISVSALGSPLGKINLADDFDAHLKMAERLFDNANILGAKNIRMFSFYRREGQTLEESREETFDKVGKMLDLADKFGVTLCHENEGAIYGESVPACLDLLSSFGGRLRCVFDMGNFALLKHKPYPDGYDALKNYIEYFHIKDSLGAGAIVPAGCGEAKIEEILKAYKTDFDRDFVITLEPHLETFSGLRKLTDFNFDNPYKFDSPEAAFIEASKCIKEIIERV